MKYINIYQAKTQLSKLVDEALAGQEIVIARNGQPLVLLIRYSASKKKRKFGALKGKVRIATDFTGPLPEDILEDFE